MTKLLYFAFLFFFGLSLLEGALIYNMYQHKEFMEQTRIQRATLDECIDRARYGSNGIRPLRDSVSPL